MLMSRRPLFGGVVAVAVVVKPGVLEAFAGTGVDVGPWVAAEFMDGVVVCLASGIVVVVVCLAPSLPPPLYVVIVALVRDAAVLGGAVGSSIDAAFVVDIIAENLQYAFPVVFKYLAHGLVPWLGPRVLLANASTQLWHAITFLAVFGHSFWSSSMQPQLSPGSGLDDAELGVGGVVVDLAVAVAVAFCIRPLQYTWAAEADLLALPPAHPA